MKPFSVARSVYWGSFASFNRNIIFWILALSGASSAAASLVIGFATITIIKSILETPAHSLLASTTTPGDWDLRSSYISTCLVILAAAVYVLVAAKFSLLGGGIVLLTVMAESFTSLSYSHQTRSGNLTSAGNRLFFLDVGTYVLMLSTLVAASAVSRELAEVFCLAFSAMLVFFRAAIYKIICGRVRIGLDLDDVLVFLRQAFRYKGYFLSSLVLALNSNIYKYLIGTQGAPLLVAVYKMMSVFVISDVLSSAIKSNLLSRNKEKFRNFSYMTNALLVSFVTVAVSLLLLFWFEWLRLVDLSVVTTAGLGLIALSKVFDSLKGYIKTQLYVNRDDISFLRSSALSIPVTILLSLLFLNQAIGLSGLIFALSASTMVLLLIYAGKSLRGRRGNKASKSSK